jgi:hypothetical protein
MLYSLVGGGVDLDIAQLIDQSVGIFAPFVHPFDHQIDGGIESRVPGLLVDLLAFVDHVCAPVRATNPERMNRSHAFTHECPTGPRQLPTHSA